MSSDSSGKNRLAYELERAIISIIIVLLDIVILVGDSISRLLQVVLSSVAFLGKSVLSIAVIVSETFSQLIKLGLKILHLPTDSLARLWTKTKSYFNMIDGVGSFRKKTQPSHPIALGEKNYTDISKVRLMSLRIKYFALGLIVSLLVVLLQSSYVFVRELPNPRLIGNVNFPVSTQIYDRNGKLLYDVFRDQDRTPVDLDELPDYLIQATIAIEDKNFYSHNGISPIGGVLRAIVEMIRSGDLQGGSTITQQLIKTSLLTPERTLERKVKEAILAVWAEQIYSKKEIMEFYLNQVPYGGSAYGIEEASKTYFNKSARELTLNEAAFLAGLTQAPTRYSPYANPEFAVQRRNEVLRNMKEQGYISDEVYAQEVQKKLDIQNPKTFIRAPHFVFYVISELEKIYGIRRVEEGGLRVITTLDIDIQQEAEKVLSEELAKVQELNIGNGAVLVTSPATGEVLAMVGSKNYFEEPYGAFNVTTALRQPGSSIKPLLYSLGLERNMTAATIINDSPVTFDVAGTTPYSPVNYDSRFHGNVPVRIALANSFNIPAVKTLNELGVPEFIQHAQSMGITTWTTPERYGLSLALGGAEVKMTDMATAYGVFANYGSRVSLNPILSVQDYTGDTLQSFTIDSKPNVLSPETSYIISDILSDNYARQFAFGLNSDLVIPGQQVAVKTGTTNNKRDNWTIGYTRKYLTSVWVGNNDNSSMSAVASGISGASPIWNRVMTYVLDKNIPLTSTEPLPSAFSLPTGVVSKSCYFGRIEYFKAGTESQGCSGKISTTPGITLTPLNRNLLNN